MSIKLEKQKFFPLKISVWYESRISINWFLDHEVTGGTVVYAKISEAQKNRFVSPTDSDSDTKVVLEVEVQGSNIQ